MDEFDELSNNKLREELKSRGLGNFPVTDTTRNLLIKKLRNAVNGTAKVTKGRRETISNVNHTEDPEINAEQKKPKSKIVSNRRTTIAVGAAPKTNATNGKSKHFQSKFISQFNIFSFIFVIGTLVTIEAAKPVPAAPKSPSRRSVAPRAIDNAKYFADNSDDDLVAAAEAVENQTRNKRSSRSPSLTKSSVVSTSYKHIIEPLVELKDDDDDDVVVSLVDESDDEFNSNMLEKVRKATPTTSITAPVDRRKTMQLGPSVITTTTTSKPIEKLPPNEESISSYRRRYTTNTPITNRAPVDSDDDILSRVETPYLSNFTRRLAELKATPIARLDDEFNDFKPKKSTYASSSYDYRSLAYPNRSSERFREHLVTTKQPKTMLAWSSFEKKIRKPLLVLLALFLIVFVYVFFFAENY